MENKPDTKGWPEKGMIGEPDGVELTFDSFYRGDNGENFAFYKTKSGFKLIIEQVATLTKEGSIEDTYHLRSFRPFMQKYGSVLRQDEKAWVLRWDQGGGI